MDEHIVATTERLLEKGIKWNEVTWYSKLLSIIFFIGVLPVLTFYIGVRYEKTEEILDDQALFLSQGNVLPRPVKVTEKATRLLTYKVDEYGFSFDYPSNLATKVVQPVKGESWPEIGTVTTLLDSTDEFSTGLRLRKYNVDYAKVLLFVGSSNLTQAPTQAQQKIIVDGKVAYKTSSFFSNMGETCIGDVLVVPLDTESLVLDLSRCFIDTHLTNDSNLPPDNREYGKEDSVVFDSVLKSIHWVKK